MIDFEAYAEQKKKEAHKEIIRDICMTINNCANCFNDETYEIDCFPLNCVNLHKVTEHSFYMEPYDNNKTNRELLDIASQHGYEAGFTIDGDETWIKFWRQ